ncbi:hypothetical protein ABMA28_011358 [Loxostege sticticalis]|uniref:Uncharacterized protein n=1 Tax=Loxostege sticticalis TaxID=481309 RepID=A0ABD0S734_LOXSC
MWWLALLLVGARALDGADAQQPDPWGDDDDDDADLYHRYDEEASSSTGAMTWTHEGHYTRVRRHDQTTSPIRTLSANELREVRDVLNQVMSGRDLSAHTQQSVTDLKRLLDIMSSTSSDLMADLANFSTRTFLRANQENRQENVKKRFEVRKNEKKKYIFLQFYWKTNLCINNITSTTTTIEPSTTTGEPTTPPIIIDIRKLVEIIANLTMNTIESNITELFNATLQKYGIPLCGETSTTEEPTYDFANATIVAKCFVCGLEDTGIPENAFCADAFAGDFLPLVPVDPRARGQIAKYRKYCRYLDVPGTMVNETQPRSVFGRWTGGCSVRWIDLSGVYTQRACRNSRHTVMGKHYVSKRMAKLEMALKDVDNGCVISPMSSLVPLSRGISLYARFHACVCTGSWCNGGPRVRPRARPRDAWLAALVTATVALAS